MKKGVSLSIHTLVIIVLAILVLVAILALFPSIWQPAVSSINLEATKNSACQRFISADCENADSISFDTVQCNTHSASNLQELAANCYGEITPEELCNCE
ncbi:MAG: hypothetical protein ACE5J4_03325 [Candidatus Aenigmatarchaeota archaeon]